MFIFKNICSILPILNILINYHELATEHHLKIIYLMFKDFFSLQRTFLELLINKRSLKIIFNKSETL